MLSSNSLRRSALLGGLILLLTGCAAFPPATERDKRDPLERFNRAVFKLNRGVDRAVARPAAKVYVAVTPKPVRAGVSNFMQNIGYPVTIANDLLQGKPLQMTRDLGRLLVNTTLGVGGLFDPATKMGLVANDEDFGQTLGKWGLHPGPYLMLPLLGPATIRDTFGRAGDVAITPRSYVKDDTTRYAVLALDLVDTRAQLLDADATLDSSFDPYGFVRDAYLQRREFLTTDGDIQTQYDEPDTEGIVAPTAAPLPDTQAEPQARPQAQQ